MSLNHTKYSTVFSIIIAFWTAVVTLSGCMDELMDKTADIPDTEVEIRGEVIYKPLVPTDVQTRAEEAPEGSNYKGIKSLYVFFFDSDEKVIEKYSGPVEFTPVPSEGSTHEHVEFTKNVKAGKYYVFAVANISDSQKSALMKVKSINELREFKLDWDDDIEKDLEMFGVFKEDYKDGDKAPDNEYFEGNELLEIIQSKHTLHSWVRRAASKVTVDFDGTNLKDGVTVYIKNAVLKDVASGALLGTKSKATDAGDMSVSKYSISYGTGEDYSSWPTVTKGTTFDQSIWGEAGKSFHDDNARSLPCYENMQEVEGKSKLQDSNKDGIIDSFTKDGVDYGTYLEVEGYYVAKRPEYKSEGKIIYRFMLGSNATDNFDLVRNHHYKITMQFKDYGNDIDWHIEYAEKYLDVTYPEDVNYQGKFFTPDIDYVGIPNAGHTFNEQNVITVTSYETNGTSNTWVTPEISYTYKSYNEKTGEWTEEKDIKPEDKWLKLTIGNVSEDNRQKTYTFVASRSTPTQTTINELFSENLVAEGNSKENPYNLSNENGGMDVKNTANCYMVGAPGWYCFPLVYGNGIEDGTYNSSAYPSEHFVNHLNKHITTPYIKDNGVDLSNVSVKLIWQDAENLISKSDSGIEIEYDPDLFDKKGGIKFHISSIKEGNAVIALIDNNVNESVFQTEAEKLAYKHVEMDDDGNLIDRGETYGYIGSTKAVWSWHIWATRFGFDDFEKNIQILNHDEKAFDMMPVNLGWCSGDSEIRYYKRRKCDITFKVGEHEITRTIEQYPHIVLPRGDHPYYQWGRKDPFVGTNQNEYNKPRWEGNDNTLIDGKTWSSHNPPRLYNEPGKQQEDGSYKDDYTADKRHTTKECLFVLIQNPDKWHNAPRTTGTTTPFISINESYDDLWSNDGEKTIYDPCPPGYQVGSLSVFSGFTTTGENAKNNSMSNQGGKYWYDVLESNMEEDYYGSTSVNSQVLELYADTRKLQSITFPVTGYRDYDNKAFALSYPTTGNNGIGYVWTNEAIDETNSYHLKFQRNDLNGSSWMDRGTEISPKESFFNTDGFAVRPVSTKEPKKQP